MLHGSRGRKLITRIVASTPQTSATTPRPVTPNPPAPMPRPVIRPAVTPRRPRIRLWAITSVTENIGERHMLVRVRNVMLGGPLECRDRQVSGQGTRLLAITY